MCVFLWNRISFGTNALMYTGIGGVMLLVIIFGLVHYRFKTLKLHASISRQGGAQFEEKVISEHHQIAPELLGDVALGRKHCKRSSQIVFGFP